MELNKNVFKQKTIEELIEEIYNKHQDNKNDIKDQITLLSNFINNTGDAIVLMPLIKGLLDSNLKNDETLLKLVQLFQKSAEANKQKQDDGFGLPEDELKQLFDNLTSGVNKVETKKIES